MVRKEFGLIVGVLVLSLFLFGVVSACTTCGNGVLDDGEECDDGNNVDGDGCSSTCKFETFCPLNENDYDQVIEINQWLVSNNPINYIGRDYKINSDIIPLKSVLSEGEYEVTLVAKDYYEGRKNADENTQKYEQYFVSFIKNGNSISNSSYTSDLADNVNFAQFNQVVN